jgi:hypothetical protein
MNGLEAGHDNVRIDSRAYAKNSNAQRMRCSTLFGA